MADFYNHCIFQAEKIANNTAMCRQCCMCINKTQKSKHALGDQEKNDADTNKMSVLWVFLALLKPEKYNTCVKIVPQ